MNKSSCWHEGTIGSKIGIIGGVGTRTLVSVIWNGSLSTVATPGVLLSVDCPNVVMISSDHGPGVHEVVLSLKSEV